MKIFYVFLHLYTLHIILFLHRFRSGIFHKPSSPLYHSTACGGLFDLIIDICLFVSLHSQIRHNKNNEDVLNIGKKVSRKYGLLLSL